MAEGLKIAILLFMVAIKYSTGQSDRISLYSKRYERIDIDTILSSRRLVTNYVDCLLNKKPCPPEGKDLKRILPEALRTKCGRCWPSQKEGAIKVITTLYYDYPDQYKALRAKWDPTGEYHNRFEEYLRDQQFNAINVGSNGDINGDQSQISISTQNGNVQRLPQPAATTTRQTTSQAPITERRTVTSVVSFTQRPIRQNVDTGNAGINQRDEVSVANRPSILSDEIPSGNAQPGVGQNVPSIGLETRFGSEDSGDSSSPPPSMTTMSMSTAPTRTTTTRPPTTVTRLEPNWQQPNTKFTQFQTRNPILNIINRLSLKFSNTADFIAGMVRETLKRT